MRMKALLGLVLTVSSGGNCRGRPAVQGLVVQAFGVAPMLVS